MMAFPRARSELAAGLLLFAPLQEPAQDAPEAGYRLLHELSGRRPGDCFGVSVAGGGDLDGDGTPDVAVGAYDFSTTTPYHELAGKSEPQKGYVQAFSGKDGRTLFELEGAAAGQGFGLSISIVGDANHDGHADLLVGAMPTEFLASLAFGNKPGRAFLHSGKDGARLAALAGKGRGSFFGVSTAGVGDLDGDGHADVAVGELAMGEDHPGSIGVFSGKDGRLLLHRASTVDGYGSCVASAGDVDRDGVPDLLVGAPNADEHERDHGLAELLSGKDLGVLRTHHGAERYDGLGACVAPVGDVDRDGCPDYLVGAQGVDGDAPGEGAIGDGTHAGAAYVFSGMDGSELRRVQGLHPVAELGSSACGMGDVDGDAVPDFAVASGNRGDGWVGLFSGAGGALLRHVPGRNVASAGDVDGDQRTDLVVGLWGRPARSPGEAAPGRALVISGRP